MGAGDNEWEPGSGHYPIYFLPPTVRPITCIRRISKSNEPGQLRLNAIQKIANLDLSQRFTTFYRLTLEMAAGE